MADFKYSLDNTDYYPAAFPKGLPTITLQKVQLADLLAGNSQIYATIYHILCTDGFFYLDLGQNPQGQAYLSHAYALLDAVKHVFEATPQQEKDAWAIDPRTGVFDTGYRAMGRNEDGKPRIAELVNVPMYELLNDPNYVLPAWLQPYEESYRGFATESLAIGTAILTALEQGLHLASGDLTAMHTPSQGTGGFVRAFRYLADSSRGTEKPISPAHNDGNSVTMLFNWQGGLQIVNPKEKSQTPTMIDGDSTDLEWLWVEPIPGHVIINLGDPMVVFSNGVLTSGRHRVMTPPGEQAKFHRYSVLAGLRPASNTPMRPLQSDVIPPISNQQKDEPLQTAGEWAMAKVSAILEKAQNSKA